MPNLVLDKTLSFDQYCSLDLSVTNAELFYLDISDPKLCQDFIDVVLQRNEAKVAWGGYLEKRNLYSNNDNFSTSDKQRNIHLGIDFWVKARTKVLMPIKGKVHSFQNNKTKGDYGPTIIMEHEVDNIKFYSLFGHLSLASIENLKVGQMFEAGDAIATIGTSDINVNYATHLHFQIIRDMQGKKGDYPGVCSEDTLPFYSKNCPDPNLLLRLPS